MGRVTSRTKFRDDARRGQFRGGKFSDWKDDGVTKGHIHPLAGLYERFNHGPIPSLEERDGKEEWKKRRYNCVGEVREEVPNPECPVCVLEEFAIEKLAQKADDREVILEGGSGKDHFALDLDDLSGQTKAKYRTRIRAKQEVALIWMPKKLHGKWKEMKEAIEIITGPQTLGERIMDVIDSEVENRGSLKGDPTLPAMDGYELRMRKGKMVISDGNDEETDFNPFPFKLKFDENKDPKLMYDAEKMDRDLCEVDDEVMQVMLADPKDELGVDLDRICGPGDPEAMMRSIKGSWVSRAIPFEEFEEFFEKKAGKKPKSSGRERERDSGRESRGRDRQGDDDAPAGRFCSVCGGKVDVGAKFCARCGEPQKSSEAADVTIDADASGLVKDKKDKPKDEKPKEEKGEERKIGDKGPTLECERCGEKVELMMPSFRCPECGKIHADLKAKWESGEDVPF